MGAKILKCEAEAGCDLPPAPHALHQQYLDLHYYDGTQTSRTDSGDTLIYNPDTRRKIQAYVDRNPTPKPPVKRTPKRNNDVFIPSEFRKSLLKIRQERSQTPMRRASSELPVQRSNSLRSRRGSSLPTQRRDSKRRNIPDRDERAAAAKIPERKRRDLKRSPRRSRPKRKPRPIATIMNYEEYSRSPLPPSPGPASISEGRYISPYVHTERSVTPLDPNVIRARSANNSRKNSPLRQNSVSFLLPAEDFESTFDSRSRSSPRAGSTQRAVRSKREFSMLGLQAVESKRRRSKRHIVAVDRRKKSTNLVGKVRSSSDSEISASFGGCQIRTHTPSFAMSRNLHSGAPHRKRDPSNHLGFKRSPSVEQSFRLQSRSPSAGGGNFQNSPREKRDPTFSSQLKSHGHIGVRCYE